MTYRDDRHALHERIAALTDEVEGLRASKLADGSTPPVDGAPPADEAAPVDPAPERGSLLGVLVMLVGAVGFAILGIWSEASRSESPVPPVLAAVPGSPAAVDPLAGLDLVLAHVRPGYALTGIDAWYVSDDGTIDLTRASYDGRVEYSVANERSAPAAPSSSAPLGARPSTVSFVGAESFQLDRKGLVRTHSESLELVTPPRVPRPHCSTREVWAAARAAGAPAGAVAHLSYGQALLKDEPSWSFEITGTPYRFTISDLTCRIDLYPWRRASRADASPAPR